MPNPRVPDAVKRQRGTYRADRSEQNARTEPENEALATYKEMASDAYTRAVHGHDVTSEVEYLRMAEDALADNGILTAEGTPWKFSVIAHLAHKAQRRA